MKIFTSVWILGVAFFHTTAFCFDRDGFYVDIPDQWEAVYFDEVKEVSLKTYGFQGSNNEQFIINFFVSKLSKKEIISQKAFLRASSVDARKTQGLRVVRDDVEIKSSDGTLDKVVSYQDEKKYTACEYRLFKKDRVAYFVLVLDEPVKQSVEKCDHIVNSILWK